MPGSMDVRTAITERRSVRGFQSRSVDADSLRSVFELAQRAPSWCNTQPWRVWVTSGDTTKRLTAAMLAACDRNPRGESEIPFPTHYPEPYGSHRRACGMALYAAMGIERTDKEGRNEAFRANYRAFGAPHIAIVAFDAHFGVYGALDVGCYLQTLMLAAQSAGLATCPQAALASYPDATRSVLPIPSELTILCGLALGYEEPTVKANDCRTARAALGDNVQFS